MTKQRALYVVNAAIDVGGDRRAPHFTLRTDDVDEALAALDRLLDDEADNVRIHFIANSIQTRLGTSTGEDTT